MNLVVQGTLQKSGARNLEMQPERYCRDGTRSYNLPPAEEAERNRLVLAVAYPKAIVLQAETKYATGIMKQVLLRV